MRWVPVLRTNGSVAQSTRSFIVIRAGKRVSLSVWLGWLPHRAEICMPEVESEGFIIGIEYEQVDVR